MMPHMDADEARRWFDSYLADFIALGRGDLDDVRRILDHYGVPMLVSTDAGTTVGAGGRPLAHRLRRRHTDCSSCAGTTVGV
jgi:hypothetical protein